MEHATMEVFFFGGNSSANMYGGGGGWFGGASHNELRYTGGGGSGYTFTLNSWKPEGFLLTKEFYLTDVVHDVGGLKNPLPKDANENGYAIIKKIDDVKTSTKTSKDNAPKSKIANFFVMKYQLLYC